MTEAFGNGNHRRLLERLVTSHHADEPTSEQRSALLRRLQRTQRAQAVPATDSEAGPRRLTNRASAGLAAAAACLLLTAAAFWSQSRAASTNSTSGARAPSASTAAHAARSVRSCVVASGTDGRLWDSTRTTPDLIQADGRFGRWMHHWSEGIANGFAAANLTPLAGGDAGFALTVAGSHAPGWGAKLGSGLRVHLGADPDQVRFDCYDASKYAGVKFSARGKGVVFVLLQTVDSVPLELGGTCTKRCWFTSSHAVALTAELREHRITWDRFSKPNSNQSAPSRLTLLEFLVQPQPEPYEVVVTNAAFMTERDASRPALHEAPSSLQP